MARVEKRRPPETRAQESYVCDRAALPVVKCPKLAQAFSQPQPNALVGTCARPSAGRVWECDVGERSCEQLVPPGKKC